MRTAIQIIQSEHNSITAVIQGLRFLAEGLPRQKPKPSYKVLRAMLYYLDTFAERFHHPKEDRYLFARLRKRTTEAEDIISRLEADHARGEDRIRELMQSVIRLEFGGDEYRREFSEQIQQYAEFYFRHMGLEEDIVLPLAQRTLTQEEWDEIDSAFAGNVDPLLGIDAKNDYEKLFARIVDLAPGHALIA
jgi:hemerythrin-like domain-containing protein